MTDADIEAVARAIYCDGTYKQYEMGADQARWAKTSETQREFCRLQARAAIAAYEARKNGS